MHPTIKTMKNAHLAPRGRDTHFEHHRPASRAKETSKGTRGGALRLSILIASAMLWTIFSLSTAQPAHSQAIYNQPAASPAMNLTTAEIVQRLEEHNQQRAAHLKHYSCKRHYHIEYHGFPGSREADMRVEMTFDAPGTKTFKTVSESGSKMLEDRILRRLMESEKEAALNPGRTALSPANYTFDLEGTGNTDAGIAYILRVEPRTGDKYLYRGKIWVDATDFAVVRIEAEPAKNPSFWIKKTDIHQRYFKVDDFWLPQQNRTETKTRFGGIANLTIDYSDYQIGPTR
jgi:hypothetical protein